MSLYPHRLLPKVYYKRIEQEGIPVNAHFLRYIEDDLQVNTKAELLNNCEKVLNPSRFPNGCSMNILSIFTKEDAKYKLIESGAPIFEPWIEGQKNYAPKEDEVVTIEDRGYFGIEYSKIINYQAEINYMDKLSTKHQATLSYIFLHAPVLTNFWHFNMFMKLSSLDRSKEIICKHQNNDISDSQIKKLVIGQLDDLKQFLLMPSEMNECKINRFKYLSITSVLKYIKLKLFKISI